MAIVEFLLTRLSFRNEHSQPESKPGGRLKRLVSRERCAVAEAAQVKLSRQASDPPPQEDVTPLYDVSAYVSSSTFPEV